MKILLSAALLACLAVAGPAAAAPASENPSMNPESGSQRGAKNDPLGVGGLTKERPKDAKTEITAKKQATFDNATSIAEFEGDVVVKDPQFTLFCDRLKVTLSKDRKGLELVEAFGNVVIRQDNKSEAGKVSRSTGRSGKAKYEPATGNIILTVWPSVQHDINLQVATEESTVMILNRSGSMETKGGSKTVIVDNSQQNL